MCVNELTVIAEPYVYDVQYPILRILASLCTSPYPILYIYILYNVIKMNICHCEGSRNLRLDTKYNINFL